MRIIVAGTRTFNDYNLLRSKLDLLTERLENIVILSGCAEGADTMGENWAFYNLRSKRSYDKEQTLPRGKRWGHVERYHADWKKHKKAAGPIRNQEMVDEADALIAFWDGKSPGTKDIIAAARKKGLKVRVILYKKIKKVRPPLRISKPKRKLRLRIR